MEIKRTLNKVKLHAPEPFCGPNSSMYKTYTGTTFYFSYDTCIAFKFEGEDPVIVKNYWGVTTGRHLNAINRDKKARLSKDAFQERLYALTR